METLLISPAPLTAQELLEVSRLNRPIELAESAVAAMETSRAVIDSLIHDERPHYGVSTGFGALATMHIPVPMRAQLQRSLIRSHAASSGAEVDREVIRGLMLNRLHTMVTGHTGVRPVVAQTYAALLNAGITPIVGEYGSLGCSGDLAPLSHCALAVMGEGTVRDASGTSMPAAQALAAAGIEPVELAEKEGLALINGTDGMLAMLAMASLDIARLIDVADLAAAMSVEGLLGTDAVFAADLHALRPQFGQAESAAAIAGHLAGSPLIASVQSGEHAFTRVQDAYSLRCAPQVHGAVRSTLAHAQSVATAEFGSAIDNPAVTTDGRVESNGNFHGAPVGYVLDFLAIALADLASMSERRTDRFLDKARSHGLNPFLADDPGVDSGHMIAQYTAAGIVSEMKRLAVPASVDSIPSSAMQEDHVSMGWAAGLKLRKAVDGAERVLAIELLTAARALDMRDGGVATSKSSASITAARKVIRGSVEGPGPDRYISPEIEAVTQLVKSGAVLAR